MSESRFRVFLRSPIVRSILCAVFLACVGFIPLLGIPGAIVYEGVSYQLNDILGLNLVTEVTGDAAWPFALMLTLFWPWSLVLGTIVGWKILPEQSSPRLRWLSLSTTVLVSCVALVLIGSKLI